MYILSSASRGGWPRIIEGNEHRGGNSRERGRGLGKGGETAQWAIRRFITRRPNRTCQAGFTGHRLFAQFLRTFRASTPRRRSSRTELTAFDVRKGNILQDLWLSEIDQRPEMMYTL